MKISVCIQSGANNTERNVLKAFYAGVERHYFNESQVNSVDELRHATGIDLELNYDNEIKPCDIAVQFGTLKDRTADHHVVKQSIAKNAGCVIYIETPLLGRVINDKNSYSQYRVGVNGFLNGQGRFYLEEQLSPGRLEVLHQSGDCPKFTGWKDHQHGDILLLLQLPGDSSLRGQKMSEWLIDTLDEIRARTDRGIIVRAHPAMGLKGRQEFFSEIGSIFFRNYKRITWSNGVDRKLAQDLKDSGVCVSYTSGSSIDAVLAGVPVIAMDEGNFAYPISSHTLEDIDHPLMVNPAVVKDWMIRLANSQWSTKEMMSGQVWSHIEPVVEQMLGP